MSAPRRSSRKCSKVNYDLGTLHAYPDRDPVTSFEVAIATLNSQAFDSSPFRRVDDILVYALFASKRRQHSYRSCVPDSAFPDDPTPISNDDGIKIRHIYGLHTQDDKGLSGIIDASEALIRALPYIFHTDCLPIVQHLLQRYYLLYSPASQVQLEKVSFDQRTIAMGLKAQCSILAGTVLLSTSTSMSLDLIPDSQRSISVIQSSRAQLGPFGPRLLLGPLRFANHDCNPNTQFGPIRGSHAYVLWAIRDITKGESVTVKYTVDTSYFPDGCCCGTCNPQQPPVATRRMIGDQSQKTNEDKQVGKSSKKRTRRGGRRGPLKGKGKATNTEDM